MHKKFEVNRTKIKGGCQSYTKAAPQEFWSDFTLGKMFEKLKQKVHNANQNGLSSLLKNYFYPDCKLMYVILNSM